MKRSLLTALAALLVLSGTAAAEGTIAGEVKRTGLWANTRAGTPSVWGSGSQPCWSDVAVRKPSDWAGRLQRAPLPCSFSASPDVDAEAVVVDQTGTAPFDYYEFWTMQWNWNVPGTANGWSAGWGGAANADELTASDGLRIWPQGMGAQGSGIAFIPGLPRVSELAAGRIPHPVQIEVPVACPVPKSPATRTDFTSDPNSPNCIPLGQKWKLPASVDISALRPAARMVAQAAKDTYLVATDQTHDKVIIRFEGVKPGQADPYYRVGGYFGCDGMQGGQPANGSEYDCWPTMLGAFRGFPWDRLVAVN
jgi:hypothetical protein